VARLSAQLFDGRRICFGRCVRGAASADTVRVKKALEAALPVNRVHQQDRSISDARPRVEVVDEIYDPLHRPWRARGPARTFPGLIQPRPRRNGYPQSGRGRRQSWPHSRIRSLLICPALMWFLKLRCSSRSNKTLVTTTTLVRTRCRVDNRSSMVVGASYRCAGATAAARVQNRAALRMAGVETRRCARSARRRYRHGCWSRDIEIVIRLPRPRRTRPLHQFGIVSRLPIELFGE